MGVADLELDLEVFSGPFDLLLTLVLREEVDLLEVELADVVLAYLDFLEARGELDLEVATEFLVLIAALLELKSRLMLPRDEDEEHSLLDVGPMEAADELLARMLEAKRYRSAAEHLRGLLADEEGVRYRVAPPPAWLRKASETTDLGEGVYKPARLGAALGALLRHPPRVDITHMGQVRVSVRERLDHLRSLLKRGRFSFDDAVKDADRVTICITLFALLEMYKSGEATWDQPEPLGAIQVEARAAAPVAEVVAS